jgi:enoyl-CoA hydratase
MDLVLTGRAVPADEAYAIGLVNRLSEPGAALAAARELATEIASFPQTCARQDRLSVLAQWGLEEGAALAQEHTLGMVSLGADALAGATRFAEGQGRHGAV